MQQQVLESIIDIKLKSTNESIPMKTKRFEFEISKYSAKKNSIWHVYINDSRIGRKSDIIITYKCSECENINQVNSTQFLRKFRSGTNRCTHCALDYHNSKPGHNKPNNKIKPVKLSFIEFHENSIRDFQSYPDEYRYAYILSHLSEEDFERLKPKIVSICNGKYTNIDNFDSHYLAKSLLPYFLLRTVTYLSEITTPQEALTELRDQTIKLNKELKQL